VTPSAGSGRAAPATPQPAWVEQATALLDQITGPHAQTKRNTIIALVDARLAGRSEETVWSVPGTCNRRNYHTKWKKNPLFAETLRAVHDLAIHHKNSRAVAALSEAAENLALASPAAVAAVVRLLLSTDEGIKLRAAFGILDRAGVETANKGRGDADAERGVNADTRRALETAYGKTDSDTDDPNPA
jgi:hypothetical protein